MKYVKSGTCGLEEIMPNGVCSVSVQYSCDTCRNNDKKRPCRCGINPMMTVMLVISGHRHCPLHNKTDKEIEQFMKKDI